MLGIIFDLRGSYSAGVWIMLGLCMALAIVPLMMRSSEALVRELAAA